MDSSARHGPDTFKRVSKGERGIGGVLSFAVEARHAWHGEHIDNAGSRLERHVAATVKQSVFKKDKARDKNP